MGWGPEDRMVGSRPSEPVVDSPGLTELPEIQVDPILGLQHNSYYREGDSGRVWKQLKAEQGQGHSHLQLIHGKLFPNAVPGSDRDSEARYGLRRYSELVVRS